MDEIYSVFVLNANPIEIPIYCVEACYGLQDSCSPYLRTAFFSFVSLDSFCHKLNPHSHFLVTLIRRLSVGTHSWAFMIEPSDHLQFASSERFNHERLLLIV
jgi:hypothetical protein